VPSVVAPFTREAERLLRAPGHFNWSTVTLLALVVYVYAVEVERANGSAVLAGVAFWLMDWFNGNERVNRPRDAQGGSAAPVDRALPAWDTCGA
jgi:hypothetical protein